MANKELREWIIRGSAVANIETNFHQLEQMLHFADLISEVNQTMNLTRITSAQDFAIKHFVDCLFLSKVEYDFKGAGIDVGTGAGFPGIVLASVITNSPIVLLDSLEKRIKFLERVKTELALSHVHCIHGRAEDWGHQRDYREQFDWGVSRAVAGLPILLEYCVPFIKNDGYFFAMKGSNVERELNESSNAIKLLGVELIETFLFELPFEMGQRAILKFKKKSSISTKYPRKAGVPSRKPL